MLFAVLDGKDGSGFETKKIGQFFHVLKLCPEKNHEKIYHGLVSLLNFI